MSGWALEATWSCALKIANDFLTLHWILMWMWQTGYTNEKWMKQFDRYGNAVFFIKSYWYRFSALPRSDFKRLSTVSSCDNRLMIVFKIAVSCVVATNSVWLWRYFPTIDKNFNFIFERRCASLWSIMTLKHSPISSSASGSLGQPLINFNESDSKFFFMSENNCDGWYQSYFFDKCASF